MAPIKSEPQILISFFEQIADKLHRFSQRGCESFWCIRLDANGLVSPKMALLALKKRFSENLPFSPEFSLFLRVRWMRMIRGRRQHNCIFQEKAGNAQKHKKSREIGDFTAFFGGGPGGIRTLDLSDANRTPSQLSYRPIFCRFSSAAGFIIAREKEKSKRFFRKMLFFCRDTAEGAGQTLREASPAVRQGRRGRPR